MEEYKIRPRGDFITPKRYEIHEGKIYNMAGAAVPHGVVSVNLQTIFKNYLKGKKCQVFGENINVIFEKGKREYMPDIKIVCDPDKYKDKKRITGAPDFIAEILSPGTQENDFGYKKDVYEQYGVKEYWIISPEMRSVQVHLLKDGRYKLDRVYTYYREDDHDYEEMTGEEKAALQTEFKTSLYDDLIIKLEDIFENID